MNLSEIFAYLICRTSPILDLRLKEKLAEVEGEVAPPEVAFQSCRLSRELWVVPWLLMGGDVAGAGGAGREAEGRRVEAERRKVKAGG